MHTLDCFELWKSFSFFSASDKTCRYLYESSRPACGVICFTVKPYWHDPKYRLAMSHFNSSFPFQCIFISELCQFILMQHSKNEICDQNSQNPSACCKKEQHADLTKSPCLIKRKWCGSWCCRVNMPFQKFLTSWFEHGKGGVKRCFYCIWGVRITAESKSQQETLPWQCHTGLTVS